MVLEAREKVLTWQLRVVEVKGQRGRLEEAQVVERLRPVDL